MDDREVHLVNDRTCAYTLCGLDMRKAYDLIHGGFSWLSVRLFHNVRRINHKHINYNFCETCMLVALANYG